MLRRCKHFGSRSVGWLGQHINIFNILGNFPTHHTLFFGCTGFLFTLVIAPFKSVAEMITSSSVSLRSVLLTGRFFFTARQRLNLHALICALYRRKNRKLKSIIVDQHERWSKSSIWEVLHFKYLKCYYQTSQFNNPKGTKRWRNIFLPWVRLAKLFRRNEKS